MTDLVTRAITMTVTAHPGHFVTGAAAEDLTDDLIHLLSNASSVTVDRVEDPERTYRLHVGMHALDYLRGPATTGLWQSDGDGWNAWGEERLADRNDSTTAHVLYRQGVTADEAERIVAGVRDLLVPSGDSDPIVAVLSDWNEWSERQDVSWSVDYKGHLVRRITTVV